MSRHTSTVTHRSARLQRQDRANQPGPGEVSYNLLQIFIGNLLPLGHIPQRNCRAMAVKGHIQHEAERITAFRGNFHAHPYLF